MCGLQLNDEMDAFTYEIRKRVYAECNCEILASQRMQIQDHQQPPCTAGKISQECSTLENPFLEKGSENRHE